MRLTGANGIIWILRGTNDGFLFLIHTQTRPFAGTFLCYSSIWRQNVYIDQNGEHYVHLIDISLPWLSWKRFCEVLRLDDAWHIYSGILRGQGQRTDIKVLLVKRRMVQSQHDLVWLINRSCTICDIKCAHRFWIKFSWFSFQIQTD